MLRTSGHSADGDARRSAVSAIHSMSPWWPAAREAARRDARLGNGVGGGDGHRVEALALRRGENGGLEFGRRSEVGIRSEIEIRVVGRRLHARNPVR